MESPEHWLLRCNGPGMAATRARVLTDWDELAGQSGGFNGTDAEKVDWVLAMNMGKEAAGRVMTGLADMRKARAKAIAERRGARPSN